MFLEDPVQRISLEGIAAHPWVTREEVPTIEEINNEASLINRARQGEINQWTKIEGNSFAISGRHG
jgi:hypothetical protein